MNLRLDPARMAPEVVNCTGVTKDGRPTLAGVERPPSTDMSNEGMHMSVSANTATSVYLYYDSRGLLIYVGITSRGISRNLEHTSKDWWPLVERQEVEHFPSRQTAHAREVELIAQFLPPFNVQHNPHHREMRDAYKRVASPAGYVDGLTLMHQLNRELPLEILTDTISKPVMLLRTRLEHEAIGAHLRLPTPVPVNGPMKGGTIESLDVRGGIALLRLRRRGRFEVHAAFAPIKAMNNEKPRGFRMSAVVLVTPDMALRAQLKKQNAEAGR